MPDKFASFFANFIVSLFILGIYPFFFSRLEADKPYAWKSRVLPGVGAAMVVVLLGSMAAVYGQHRVTGGQQQDTGAPEGKGIEAIAG